jgi:hypothetical protein
MLISLRDHSYAADLVRPACKDGMRYGLELVGNVNIE